MFLHWGDVIEPAGSLLKLFIKPVAHLDFGLMKSLSKACGFRANSQQVQSTGSLLLFIKPVAHLDSAFVPIPTDIGDRVAVCGR